MTAGDRSLAMQDRSGAPTQLTRGMVYPRVPVGAGLVIGLVIASSAALLVARGDPTLALLPLVLAVVIYIVATRPLRWTLYPLLGLMILANVSAPLPSGEPWISPVQPLQLLLLDNLDKIPGLAAFHFAGIEVLMVLLAMIAMTRVAIGYSVDRAGRLASSSALDAALILAFLAALALEAWGVARGGDFRQSLWQVRYILWLPVLTALVLFATRGLRDCVTLAIVVTVTACIKVGIGLYFYEVIARPTGVRPAMVTSHYDSVLFVAVIAIWLAAIVYGPTPRRMAIGAAVSLWMIVGLIINNRRTAFVGLLGSLVVLYFMLPALLRRRIARLGLCMLPLLVLYVEVGQHQTSAFFAPAASIMSVTQQKDASSETRDIEDFNLVTTLKQNMLAGSGWGHEYIELSKAYDISFAFEQYRYIAHNSVLWLWSLSGLLGFTLLWLPFVVSVFLAARSQVRTTRPDDRAACYVVVAVIAIFLVQAWADMGTQSWTSLVLLAAAFTTSSKVATGTGAWPAHVRLIGWRLRAPPAARTPSS
jgi:hypothetical protein